MKKLLLIFALLAPLASQAAAKWRLAVRAPSGNPKTVDLDGSKAYPVQMKGLPLTCIVSEEIKSNDGFSRWVSCGPDSAIEHSVSTEVFCSAKTPLTAGNLRVGMSKLYSLGLACAYTP